MTIAIAIPCEDGVVLASDSMGSSDRIATRIQKVWVTDAQDLTWATTGSEYMSQAVGTAMRDLTVDADRTPGQVVPILAQAITEATTQPLLPSDSNASPHHVECFVASWHGDRPSIIHLPADLAPVECHDKRFVAMGSAADYAHVVAGALEHHLNLPLPLMRGKLLAYRIISTVCSVSSWGVALPVQMATASHAGVTLIDSDELEQINAEVDRWLAVESSQFEPTEAQTAREVDESTSAPTQGERFRGQDL